MRRPPRVGMHAKWASIIGVVAGLSMAGCDKDPEPWRAPEVRINEVVPSNRTGLMDASGAFPDWIELYNAGAELADLSSFTLTDDPAEPQKWTFPAGTEIASDGYLIVFADGDPTTAEELHANFRLSADGETIQLIGPATQDLPIIDELTFPPMAPDDAWARDDDGLFSIAEPTPGAPNP